MIVWGGGGGVSNTGGIYDSGTDTWAATSTTGAPSPRLCHAAVSTRSKMIVWGGYDGAYPSTGGVYDPGTDTWTATSVTNAPAGRERHTVVWTGSRMIVWGGYWSVYGGWVNTHTGGVYDPGNGHLGGHEHDRSTHTPEQPHGGVDRIEDDRLGCIRRCARQHGRCL